LLSLSPGGNRLITLIPDPTDVGRPARERARHHLESALETYRGRIVLACSFGGPAGMVALDIAMGIDPTLPVYFIDTGVLFPETYARSRSGTASPFGP